MTGVQTCALPISPDLEDTPGRLLYCRGCADSDRRSGEKRADLRADHESPEKRKMDETGRFLVGIF